MLGLDRAALARQIPATDLIGEAHAKTDDIVMAERAVLHRALVRSNGNVSKAAKDLNMSRATMHRKLKQLGLHNRGDS